jgi:GNAT superfamily N-acetyltransferase
MRIVEVGSDSLLVGEIYSDLFLQAFNADELVSRDQLQAGLRGGLGILTAVLDRKGRPLAAAFGEWDPDSRVLLLSYIAVHREQRSMGLGGLLMGEIGGAWQDRYHPELTLAEIEHPLAHYRGPNPNHGDNFARMRFYGRHGARALDLPYFQPALRPGAERIYGMVLIALAPLSERERGGFVAAAPVRAFLTGYFLSCEGAVGTDSASRQLWQAVDHPGGIRLLPLDDPAALQVSADP